MRLVDTGKTWFVLRCFSGREKEAAADLHKLGYDAYCPTRRKDKIHRRTNVKSTVEEALWPGYLFLAQPRWIAAYGRYGDDFAALKEADGAIDLLRPSKSEDPFCINANIVEGIQIAENNMEFDETEAADLHRGVVKKTAKEQAKSDFPVDSVAEITSDLWEGHLGKVIEHTKTGHVKLAIQALGGSFTLDTHADKLRPAA